MIRLYNCEDSGNSYKVRLLLTQLQVPFERIDIDLIGRETGTPRFRARNPLGQTPFVELDDGRVLAESNAILWYLAEGTPLVPAERWARAEVLQWMFFEQYSHEPYIAVARFWIGFTPQERLEPRRHLIPEWHAKGNAALGVMETHLARHDWFAGGRYSIADIALYGYTHCAADGGFDLAPYPAVGTWLKRVAAQPGYVPLELAW